MYRERVMCVYVILNMNIHINTVGTSTKELKRKLELAMKKLSSKLQLHILKDPSLISNEFKSQARMLYNAAKTNQQQILDHLDPAKTHLSSPIHIISAISESYYQKHPTIFPMGIFLPQLKTKRDFQPCRSLDQRPAPKPQGCLRHGEAPASGDTGPPRSGPRVGFNGVWVSPKNGWFLHCLKVSCTKPSNGCFTTLKKTHLIGCFFVWKKMDDCFFFRMFL